MAYINNGQIYVKTEEEGPQIQFIANEQPIQVVTKSQVLSNNNNECQEGYSPAEPNPIVNLQLPPPNLSCYQEPPIPRGEIKYIHHDEPTITKTITQNFNALKTVIKENTIHHQHSKTVITNVNRNHWHTQRVVVKDNHFHHHLVNNVIKVSDVHHQKIEQVRGEGKTFNDFKQTQRVEGPLCLRDDQPSNNCDREAEPVYQQSVVLEQQRAPSSVRDTNLQLAHTLNTIISANENTSAGNNSLSGSFLLNETERSAAASFYN
jgi:hypothetical protein